MMVETSIQKKIMSTPVFDEESVTKVISLEGENQEAATQQNHTLASLEPEYGKEENQTLVLQGESHGRQLKPLIDGGSSVSFLNEEIAKTLQL